MVSLKNGVLKITHEEKSARTIYEICFAVNMLSIFLLANVKYVVPLMGFVLLACAFLVAYEEHKRKIVVPYNTIWYIALTIFAALSSLWAIYLSASIYNQMLRFVVEIAVITSISMYVDTLEHLERLISIYIFCLLVMVVVELIVAGPDRWFIGALGHRTSKFNSNEFGLWLTCGEMLCFYEFYIKGKKRYFPVFALFIFMVVLTSSRKALVACLVAPIALIAIYTQKKNAFLKILLLLASAAIILYIIMTNDKLYTAVGRRIQSMLDFFSDNERSSDNSLYRRRFFINLAKEMFKESPIFGKGLRTFGLKLMKEYGQSWAYSHNNYWQLLSELGIVGFVLYYWLYGLCIVRLAKNFIKKKSPISGVFLVMLLMIMCMEYGFVDYYTKSVQITVAMIYTASYVGVEDGRKFGYIEENVNELEE